MAQFRYRALAPNGDVTEGVMDAPDRDAVISRLRASNHLPVMAAALDDDAAGEPPAAPGKAARRWWLLARNRQIRPAVEAACARGCRIDCSTYPQYGVAPN